jgi:hypothetical protein
VDTVRKVICSNQGTSPSADWMGMYDTTVTIVIPATPDIFTAAVADVERVYIRFACGDSQSVYGVSPAFPGNATIPTLGLKTSEAVSQKTLAVDFDVATSGPLCTYEWFGVPPNPLPPSVGALIIYEVFLRRPITCKNSRNGHSPSQWRRLIQRLVGSASNGNG